MSEYAFRRLKHPEESIEFITVDSLRRALNIYDVKNVTDEVLTLMMEIAKNISQKQQKTVQQASEPSEDAARAQLN